MLKSKALLILLLLVCYYLVFKLEFEFLFFMIFFLFIRLAKEKKLRVWRDFVAKEKTNESEFEAQVSLNNNQVLYLCIVNK